MTEVADPRSLVASRIGPRSFQVFRSCLRNELKSDFHVCPTERRFVEEVICGRRSMQIIDLVFLGTARFA
jgi:hypothetical protein